MYYKKEKSKLTLEVKSASMIDFLAISQSFPSYSIPVHVKHGNCFPAYVYCMRKSYTSGLIPNANLNKHSSISTTKIEKAIIIGQSKQPEEILSYWMPHRHLYFKKAYRVTISIASKFVGLNGANFFPIFKSEIDSSSCIVTRIEKLHCFYYTVHRSSFHFKNCIIGTIETIPFL